jgi:plasmid stability protein
MPKQITIRKVPDELGRRLKRLAQESGTSLNTTVLRVLGQSLGIDARRRMLEEQATWTAEDLEEFEGVLRAQRQVDEHLWK